MSIDKNIYNNGVKGNLSYYEIASLPKDYEVYKPMFWEATWVKEGKPHNKFTYEGFTSQPKKMNKLQEELRFMQVISRAIYGMSIYGTCADKDLYNMPKQGWFAKLLFWLNPKRLWNMWKLKCGFKKLWHSDREKYKEATKILDKTRKKMGGPFKYDVDRGDWTPIPSC